MLETASGARPVLRFASQEERDAVVAAIAAAQAGDGGAGGAGAAAAAAAADAGGDKSLSAAHRAQALAANECASKEAGAMYTFFEVHSCVAPWSPQHTASCTHHAPSAVPSLALPASF